MEAIAITDKSDDGTGKIPDLPDARLVEIVHLAEQGKTWEEIAIAIKVSSKTVWQWRQRYQIDAIIAQRNQDMLRATLQHRVRLVKRASEILDGWLNGEDNELKQYAIDKVYPKQGGGDIQAPALPRGEAAKPEAPGAAGKRLSAAKRQGRL